MQSAKGLHQAPLAPVDETNWSLFSILDVFAAILECMQHSHLTLLPMCDFDGNDCFKGPVVCTALEFFISCHSEILEP